MSAVDCRGHVGMVYGAYLEVGGVEKHLLQLSTWLRDAGGKATIFSGTSPAFRAQLESVQAEVVDLSLSYLLDFRALGNLIAYCKEREIELLHAHHPRTYLLCGVTSKILGIPAIATVHIPAGEMGHESKFKQLVYQLVENWLLALFFAKVVFVSRQAVGGRLIEHKSEWLPNSIDVQQYHPMARQTARSAEDPVILCGIGRLHPQKGFDLLVQALAPLRDHPVNWQCWLVGDGAEKTMLENSIFELGLQDQIKLLGWRDDIPELLAQADMFVMPSRFEGYPYVLLEAMASGLPVIASKVGGVEEIITDHVDGILVAAQDVQALAGEIARLLNEPQLRADLGQAAHNKAQTFDQQKIKTRMLAIYEQFCPGL